MFVHVMCLICYASYLLHVAYTCLICICYVLLCYMICYDCISHLHVFIYLLYMFSLVCEVLQQVQRAHASIGARFLLILLLITLKVRFRIKYRILDLFCLVLDLFSRVGYPHHLQMRCIFVFFVRKFFPVEPRKGGAGEIFRDSGRQKNFEDLRKILNFKNFVISFLLK